MSMAKSCALVAVGKSEAGINVSQACCSTSTESASKFLFYAGKVGGYIHGEYVCWISILWGQLEFQS